MNTSVEQTIQDAAAQHIDQSNQSFVKLRLVANAQWKTVEVNGEDVEIPQGWSVTTYENVADFINGDWGSISTIDNAGNICYRKADYEGNKIKSGSTFRVSKKEPFVSKFDTIIEKSGGGEKSPVGAPALVLLDVPAICSNFMVCAKTLQSCDKLFFFYQYQELYKSSAIYSLYQQTTGIQNLQINVLKKMNFTFPPLREQTLIAQILTTQEEHIANLKQQSSVQRKRLDWLTSELLTGRILVHEDINGEPTVLERDDQGNVLKSLPAVTMSANTQWKTVEVNGEDVEIPQGWYVKKIGNDINFTLGYTPSKTGTNYKGDIPWITISNLDNSGHVKNFTALIKNSRTRILPKGSLIGSFKMTIGRFGITCMDAVTNEAIVGAAPNDAPLHDLNYLRFALVSPFKKGAVTNGQGVQLLNTKIIKSLQFISPQKSEQTLIAQILTTQEEHISLLDKAIELEEQRLAWLTDELLSGRILVEEVTK